MKFNHLHIKTAIQKRVKNDVQTPRKKLFSGPFASFTTYGYYWYAFYQVFMYICFSLSASAPGSGPQAIQISFSLA